MVPLKNKIYLLQSLLDSKKLLSYSFDSFIRQLLDKQDFLDKIDFVTDESYVKYDYALHVSLKRNLFFLEVNQEKIDVSDPLFYTFFYLRVVQSGDLCIYITDFYENINIPIYDACVNTYTMHNVVFNAIINDAIKDVKKQAIYEKIQEALKQKDKEEFMKWSNIYNNM